MIEIPRRKFLTGLLGLVAAPAVVKAAGLMPVRSIPPAPLAAYGRPLAGELIDTLAQMHRNMVLFGQCAAQIDSAGNVKVLDPENVWIRTESLPQDEILRWNQPPSCAFIGVGGWPHAPATRARFLTESTDVVTS